MLKLYQKILQLYLYWVCFEHESQQVKIGVLMLRTLDLLVWIYSSDYICMHVCMHVAVIHKVRTSIDYTANQKLS